MKIDLDAAKGEILACATKREEGDDGESSRTQLNLTVSVTAEPRFLDDYLRGHDSGAQPSDVLWRVYPDTKGRFVRYLGVDRLVLAVPESVRYQIRLSQPPPADADLAAMLGSENLAEVTLDDVQLMAASVVLAANAAVVKMRLRAHPQPEIVRIVTELQNFETVLVSMWTPAGDLFDGGTPPTAATLKRQGEQHVSKPDDNGHADLE